VSGSPITGVKVFVSGPVTLELTTDANGTATLNVMPDGTYRLRFERDGFTTFEREVTAKAGQPGEIYVALRMAPPLPAPAPAPAPAAAPAPPPPVVSTGPAGPPVFVSIPEFLDKNYIRREPLKESVLGCLGDSTTRLLQLHESIAEHTHSEMDEMLYVVAGEGAIRIKGESTSVAAGSLTIVPRGLQHSIERRGKNPLMVLSTLSGAPCRPEPPAPSKVTSNNKK
jgi:mannose-6-phosphate isomerase-like protein (cupin superfamily)